VSYLFPASTITVDAALRDLASGSPKSRAQAAHALGDVGDPVEKARAVPALITALADDRPEVRAEACASLGELGDDSAVPGLIRALDDGAPTVRQSAAIALGSLRHPDGFPALVERLREGGPDLRFQAATSLAEIDPIAAYDPLVAALGDGDPQVLSSIALSLGAIGDGRAVGHLARLLDHADPAVRFDAAYALAQLADPRGRAQLRGGLTDQGRAWDAVIALETLGEEADADAILDGMSARGVAPMVQLRAAGALVRIGKGRHVEPARRVLAAGLAARKLELRGLAVEELGRTGAPWAADLLHDLRGRRKGRELVDAIDDALEQIRKAGPAAGPRP
jgi:HEAT repeat protein